MTPLEKAEAEVEEWVDGVWDNDGEPEASRALIRAVEHRCAERIRVLNPQPDGWNEVLVEYIADLIDPDVEDS